MKHFSVISLVIIVILVTKSESKDFCEAFKDNGFRVDYFFEYINSEETDPVSDITLIIGYHYWVAVEQEDNDENVFIVKLKSSKGLFSEVFGNHYISAFSVRKSEEEFIYGFIRKNDSSIEWKELKVRGLRPMDNEAVNTSVSPFPRGFNPVISLAKLLFHNGTYVIQRHIFVDQKPMPTETDVFQRTFIGFDFVNGFQEIKQMEDYSRQGGRSIIATVGPFKPENDSKNDFFVVFFAINDRIDYCVDLNTNAYDPYVEHSCLSESKVLVDCSHLRHIKLPVPQSNDGLKLWQIIGIVIGIVVLILMLILCVLCVINWLSATKEDPTKPAKTINSDTGGRISSNSKTSDSTETKVTLLEAGSKAIQRNENSNPIQSQSQKPSHNISAKIVISPKKNTKKTTPSPPKVEANKQSSPKDQKPKK